MEGPGTDETKPHLKDLGRPAWPKVRAGSNEPKTGLGRCDHFVALSLLGPLRSCSGI